MTKRILPFFISHQGCHHQCVFCNQRVINQSYDAGFDDFEAMIAKFIQNQSDPTYDEIAFYGGSFTGLPPALLSAYLKAGKALIDQGLIKGLRCSTRPDYIRSDILDLLVESGMTTIELGVQSMDPGVLSLVKRGYGPEDVVGAAHAIKAKGLALGLQIMVGLPGDTKKSFDQTLEAIIGLKPDYVRVYPVQVLADTDLALTYLKGNYHPLGLREALHLSQRALVAFSEAGIPVIKLGLHANTSLFDPAYRLAGPYHPAFRELVEALVIREEITPFLQGLDHAQNLTVYLHPTWVSKFVGVKKMNRHWIKARFGYDIKVVKDHQIDKGTIRFKTDLTDHEVVSVLALK